MKRTRAGYVGIGVSLALGLAVDARAQDGLSPTPAVQDDDRTGPVPATPAEPSPFETFPPPAAAPEGPAFVQFELAARGGYMTSPMRGGISPFGLGAGGGLSLAIGHVVLGVSVVGYVGSSDDAGSSERAVLYGGEGGYDIRVGRLTLRPFVGLGGAAITHSIPTTTTLLPGNVRAQTARTPAQIPDVITQATSSSGGGSSVSPTNDVVVTTYYVEPGLMAVYSGASGAFVGLRASVVYFPSVAYAYDTSARWMTLATHLTVGIRF